jgi:KamA family protein
MTTAIRPETAPAFRAIGPRALGGLLDRTPFDSDQRDAVLAVAAILPFRVNSYVLDELIDWAAVPDDPIFRLTFPQPEMFPEEDLAPIIHHMRRNADEQVRAHVQAIRGRLNPHPAGQTDLNVPTLDGAPVLGLQHKYRETVLFFPKNGQTCHAYCTYCFRWPQFTGEPDLKITGELDQLTGYLRAHPEVTDVLITGGDPMLMSTQSLARCIEPLLAPEFSHVTSIRIGTKALSYWPYRFTSAPDADDLSRLFERITGKDRNLAVMAHVSHPRELSTAPAQEAVSRIRNTGAVLRTQAPLIRTVNDDPAVWAQMWRSTVRLGGVPYYMFIARDTGPREYFQVPLARAWEIFRDAYASVSGLARTVRGPSMSATAGKVCIDGIAISDGQPVFVLRYLQARDPSWVGRPFFAKYDESAAWLTDLQPVGPLAGQFSGGL